MEFKRRYHEHPQQPGLDSSMLIAFISLRRIAFFQKFTHLQAAIDIFGGSICHDLRQSFRPAANFSTSDRGERLNIHL